MAGVPPGRARLAGKVVAIVAVAYSPYGGMARLSADLASGRWHQRYGHLLALDELDLGYCVVIARP